LFWSKNKPTTTRGNQFFRRQGKGYKDEGAAMEVFGTLEKQELKESPFRKYFEFGMNNEGYWGYSHMVTPFLRLC
jgi:hypothetical protein